MRRAPWVPERQWTGTALRPGNRPGTGSPVPQGLPASRGVPRGPTTVRTEAGPRPSPRPLRRAGVRVSCRPLGDRATALHAPRSAKAVVGFGPKPVADRKNAIRCWVKVREPARPASKDGLAKPTHEGPPSPRSARATCRASRGSVRYPRGGRAARRCVLARLPERKVQPKGLLRAEAQSIRLGVSRRGGNEGWKPCPVSMPSVAPWRVSATGQHLGTERRRWSGPMTLALLIRGGRGPGSEALGKSHHDSILPVLGSRYRGA